MKSLTNGVILLGLATMLILTACSSGSASEYPLGKQKDYPSNVTMVTASQGGAFYLIGGGLGSVLEKMDVLSNIEATGGPIHNLLLIDNGDADLGFTTTGPLSESYSGEGVWLDEPLDGIRVAFPMYYTPFQWWSLEGSGVTSLQDLKDQRVGVGPSGGTSGTYSPVVHEILGLETTDVQAGIGDLGSQMLDRQLDTISFAGGLPTPSASEIEAQANIKFFGIEDNEKELIMNELDYFEEYTIPEETYNSLDEDMETIAMYNYGVVNHNANEDFVYDLVKAYHENIDEMISVHSSLREAADPEAILQNQLYPMHPGAIRYYEEIGIGLPEEVYPEEWDGE